MPREPLRSAMRILETEPDASATTPPQPATLSLSWAPVRSAKSAGQLRSEKRLDPLPQPQKLAALDRFVSQNPEPLPPQLLDTLRKVALWLGISASLGRPALHALRLASAKTFVLRTPTLYPENLHA